MAEYGFTRSAREDLVDIWLHTQANWGEGQADRYQDALHDCCARIADGTARTRPIREIDGVRSHRCKHHYLFFVEQADGIVIVAVLHERMDLIERLRNRL